jgi:SulP family sulfate permease
MRLLASAPWPDRIVFAITCLLTVLVDLTIAVQVGVILAAVLVMRQLADTVQITTGVDITDEEGRDAPGVADLRSRLPEGVETFTLRGPLFYAAVERFRITLDRVAQTPKILILRMRDVTFVDATAAFAIVEMTHAFERKGTTVILAAAPRSVLRTLIGMGLREDGKVLAEGSTDAAIARARLILGTSHTG